MEWYSLISRGGSKATSYLVGERLAPWFGSSRAGEGMINPVPGFDLLLALHKDEPRLTEWAPMVHTDNPWT